MEDNLKILQVEYFNNDRLDFAQKLNLSSGDQTKIKNPLKLNIACLKGRWPPMEKDLKILKVEYLSNQWSDFFLNFEFELRGPNQNQILKF